MGARLRSTRPASAGRIRRQVNQLTWKYIGTNWHVYVKVCSRCKTFKSLDLFYANKRMSDGKSSACKECMRPGLMKAKLGRETRNNPVSVAEKQCKVCLSIKPAHEFNRSRLAADGLNPKCSNCRRAERATDKHRWSTRVGWVYRNYGLAEAEYMALLEAQGWACAICSIDLRTVNHHIDHDHDCCPGGGSCGHCVRGVLCPHCNRGLGQFRDSQDLLRKATTYLHQKRQSPPFLAGLTCEVNPGLD